MELLIDLKKNGNERTFLPLPNLSADTRIADVKSRLSSETGIRTQDLHLIYCGKTFNDDEPLSSLGLSIHSVIHARVVPQESQPKPRVLSSEEQRELLVTFRTAMTNPNFRQTLQSFSKPEKFAELVASTPGLANDPVAKAFIRDWELLLHLADSKCLSKLVKNYPALADAGTRIAVTLSELTPSVDLRTLRRSQQGRLARSLGADIDDEDADEDEPMAAAEDPARMITPEQLAQALALAQRSMGSSARQPAASSSTPASQPGPSQSATSPATLTQQMFAEALMQAVAAGNSSSRPRREASSDLNQQFGRFLPQMRELGITDDMMSLRALQATNGDVQAAVNLIFAGLMDD